MAFIFCYILLAVVSPRPKLLPISCPLNWRDEFEAYIVDSSLSSYSFQPGAATNPFVQRMPEAMTDLGWWARPTWSTPTSPRLTTNGSAPSARRRPRPTRPITLTTEPSRASAAGLSSGAHTRTAPGRSLSADQVRWQNHPNL